MTADRDSYSKARNWLFLGHVLFFGALYFVYSPFFALPAPIRFGGFAALLFCGAALIMESSSQRLERTIWIVLAFLFLYGTAVFRMNEMIPEKSGETILLNYQMAALSMLAFVSSVAISTNLDLTLMRRALLVVSVPCGLWICFNFQDLSDYSLSDSFALGNLSYHSYQVTSTLLAISSLSALAEVDFSRMTQPKNILAGLIFLLFGYFVFQGLGRGEAIAFTIAVAFYLSPRVALLAIPFSYSIILFIVFSISTPFTERMKFIIDGDYGARDELLGYSFALIGNEPYTVLWGGGLNYFQNYWNFTSGTYPHNIPVEALISGGIFLFVFFLFVYFVPLLRATLWVLARRVSKENSYALCLSIMLLFIMLKSGTLLTFWTLGIFTCAFLSLYDVAIPVRRTRSRMHRDIRFETGHHSLAHRFQSPPTGSYSRRYPEPTAQPGFPPGSWKPPHSVSGWSGRFPAAAPLKGDLWRLQKETLN